MQHDFGIFHFGWIFYFGHNDPFFDKRKYYEEKRIDWQNHKIHPKITHPIECWMALFLIWLFGDFLEIKKTHAKRTLEMYFYYFKKLL